MLVWVGVSEEPSQGCIVSPLNTGVNEICVVYPHTTMGADIQNICTTEKLLLVFYLFLNCCFGPVQMKGGCGVSWTR